jgi:hypothetical protein
MLIVCDDVVEFDPQGRCSVYVEAFEDISVNIFLLLKNERIVFASAQDIYITNRSYEIVKQFSFCNARAIAELQRGILLILSRSWEKGLHTLCIATGVTTKYKITPKLRPWARIMVMENGAIVLMNRLELHVVKANEIVYELRFHILDCNMIQQIGLNEIVIPEESSILVLDTTTCKEKRIKIDSPRFAFSCFVLEK